MNKQSIQNKIKELELWLTNHPNHSNYTTVLRDKNDLEKRLKTSTDE